MRIFLALATALAMSSTVASAQDVPNPAPKWGALAIDPDGVIGIAQGEATVQDAKTYAGGTCFVQSKKPDSCAMAFGPDPLWLAAVRCVNSRTQSGRPYVIVSVGVGVDADVAEKAAIDKATKYPTMSRSDCRLVKAIPAAGAAGQGT